MKLGVISQNLEQFEFEEGLKYAHDMGFQAVEVGAMGLWGRGYCDVEKLLADGGEVRRWLDAFDRHELEISAFGGHGAPLMPVAKIAARYDREFRQTCKLAEIAGIKRITLLAGLPEGAEGDTAPNWVTFCELPFLRDTLQWQWENRLIPYWREHGKIAADHGVTLCFEMHAGDMLHNPTTVMRLRDEIGPVIATNLDTSHLWLQGIDPVQAVRFLGEVVQHVHVKDTLISDTNRKVRGHFDSSAGDNLSLRYWNFTIPGWGHGASEWREFVIALRMAGYDHVLSLEMESELFEVEEGLEKGAQFLKPIVLQRPPGKKWWEHVGLDGAGSLY